MTDLQELLFSLRDAEYAQFQAKLIPGISPDSIIGVRVPVLRKIAKQLIKKPESRQFLKSLPHKYFDENILHGLLLSELTDYGNCIALTDLFLPYVDNWAVCDIMSPKVLKKHKSELMQSIRKWSKSSHTYTCRFGLEMLMRHFLDTDFSPKYLEIPTSTRSEDYYVRMMVAWFLTTALTKQWNATIPIIESKVLLPWIHNKTIQKACESFCITPQQKEYLRTFKLK